MRRAAGQQIVLQRRQLERIAPDHQVAHRPQIVHHRAAAVCLADAGDAVVADDLDDRAQRLGRVQSGRRSQRRVAERDRRDAVIDDFHHNSPVADFIFGCWALVESAGSVDLTTQRRSSG